MKIHIGMSGLVAACLMMTLLMPMAALGQEEVSWVERSNENSQILLLILAKWAPELGTELGIPGLDEEISQLPSGFVQLVQDDLLEAKTELTRRLDIEENPAVRQDLEEARALDLLGLLDFGDEVVGEGDRGGGQIGHVVTGQNLDDLLLGPVLGVR